MSDYLPIKDWFKFKRGEIVYVKSYAVVPPLDGLYKISRIRRCSNFPHEVEHQGSRRLLHKREVFKAKDLV